MTRKDFIDALCKASEGLYDRNESRSIAHLVAQHELGLRREEFLIYPDEELRHVDEERLAEICRQLAAGRPVQYILGRQERCGMDFWVDEEVLIPRPETEELVEWIAQDGGGRTVLDIGTGSGLIAVALAKRLPAAEVTATDISERALAVAARNASRNGVKVRFLQHDILSSPLAGGTWDTIVSNPPYIPLAERETMHTNVRDYEPSLALFVPDHDPVLFYRTIARRAKPVLADGGRLYFEIHERFAEAVTDLLDREGYENITVRKDVNDKPRMIRCRKR